MGIKIDKQFGLDRLKEHCKIYNKILTREEFKKYNINPSYSWYERNFGDYKNACYEAGLIEKPLTEEERIKISVNELIKLAHNLNKCPTVAEYESIKHRGYQRRDLEKHFAVGDTVNLVTLLEKKLISKNIKAAKILHTGELTKKLVIEGVKCTKTAKEVIEKLGGEVK